VPCPHELANCQVDFLARLLRRRARRGLGRTGLMNTSMSDAVTSFTSADWRSFSIVGSSAPIATALASLKTRPMVAWRLFVGWVSPASAISSFIFCSSSAAGTESLKDTTACSRLPVPPAGVSTTFFVSRRCCALVVPRFLIMAPSLISVPDTGNSAGDRKMPVASGANTSSRLSRGLTSPACSRSARLAGHVHRATVALWPSRPPCCLARRFRRLGAHRRERVSEQPLQCHHSVG